MAHVLVIDDEASMRYTLEAVLGDAGHQITVADGGAAGIEAFEDGGADVVITDLAMPEVDGMTVLATLRAQDPTVPVMMLTAHGSERVAVAAMKAGAFDYIPKPFDPDEIVLSVSRAADTRRLRLENARLRTEASLGRPIVAESPALRRVLDLVTRVAPKDVTVLLTGESGVGKDVLAATLHAHSKRADKPLVRFNAAAIPAELAESELFGHVKGAFTGAVRDKAGLLETANGGTLFLDELTEMPMPLQAKLLRVIQDGVVRRVGSNNTSTVVNVRFIAASNRDADEAVRTGVLREDLYYRLRVVPIAIPPLRDRHEDIALLASHFLRSYWRQHRGGETRPATLTDEAIRALQRYEWPGNVRELQNAIEHAVVLLEPGQAAGAADIPISDNPALERPVASGAAPAAADAADADLLSEPYHVGRERVIAQFERRYLAELVRATQGNMSKAARMAGVDRTTLYRLMERHGLQREAVLSPNDR